MAESILKVTVLPEELAVAMGYAQASVKHTIKKLEFQRSRFSDRERNIIVGRVARTVVARVLRDADVSARFEEAPATKAKNYCIVTGDGQFIQTRFIGDYPKHKNLLV